MKYILFILALAVRVAAASVTHTAQIFVAPTDWVATNAVPQFDSALGTLTNVSVSVAINGTTSIRFENLDEFYEGDITGGGVITGTATAAGFSVATKLTNSHTQTVTGMYDGVLDYAGSGGFRLSISGSSASSASPADFTPFIGVGNIPLIASATGAGIYDGPGDYAFGVTTRASALVTITYEFSPPACPDCDCDPAPDCKPDPNDDCRKPSRRHRR